MESKFTEQKHIKMFKKSMDYFLGGFSMHNTTPTKGFSPIVAVTIDEKKHASLSISFAKEAKNLPYHKINLQ